MLSAACIGQNEKHLLSCIALVWLQLRNRRVVLSEKLKEVLTKVGAGHSLSYTTP